MNLISFCLTHLIYLNLMSLTILSEDYKLLMSSFIIFTIVCFFLSLWSTHLLTTFVCGLLGYDAVQSCRWLTTFCRNLFLPGPLKTFLTTYKTAWHHNPEDHNPNSHCSKNLNFIPSNTLNICSFLQSKNTKTNSNF
jgi:hypothetical protein